MGWDVGVCRAPAAQGSISLPASLPLFIPRPDALDRGQK